MDPPPHSIPRATSLLMSGCLGKLTRTWPRRRAAMAGGGGCLVVQVVRLEDMDNTSLLSLDKGPL